MFRRPRSSRERETTVAQGMKRKVKEVDHNAAAVSSEATAALQYCQNSNYGYLCSSDVAVDLQASESDIFHYNRLKLTQRHRNEEGSRYCTNKNYESVDIGMGHHTQSEHYNKLKINVTGLLHYKITTGVGAPSTPVHFSDGNNSRNGRVTSSSLSSPKRTHSQVSVAKYKKEGHSNQVYAISRHETASAKPPISKSRSTGDINSHYDNSVRERNTRQLKSLHSMVSVSGENTAMLNSRQEREALSSRNAHSSTVTSLHSRSSTRGCDLSFMNKVITFTCTHEGKEISSTAYDFSVNLQKGSIKKQKSVDFQVGICLHGPFVLPKGYRPVSPIVMVTAQQVVKLKKPLEISLPHCIDVTEQLNEHLTFFHARKTDHLKSTHTQHKYLFRQANNDDTSTYLLGHGKLRTTDMGFFCIMAKENTDLRQNTNYCVVPVVPRCITSPSWTIHYCVTYLLKSFLTVSEQKSR